MTTLRWLKDNHQRCSLASIPEAIIRDNVFAFLPEEEAFTARGTCFLFAQVYFYQSYKSPNIKRLLTMLNKGYLYPKLMEIYLELEHSTPKYLQLLKHLPGLRELVIDVANRTFEINELPTNLVHLQTLEINYESDVFIMQDLSGLSSFSSLENVTLWNDHKNNVGIQLETFPEILQCLRRFEVNRCYLTDVSVLSRFPTLEELIIPNCGNVIFDTIPVNLAKLKELNVMGCNLTNLSHLSRFKYLQALNMSHNRTVELDTISHGLCRKRKFNEDMARVSLSNGFVHLRKLYLANCNLTDVSALSHFPGLEECGLALNRRIVIESIPESLVHLRKLGLRHCDLCDVSSLGRLVALEEVDFEGNEDLLVKTVPAGLTQWQPPA